MRPFLSLARQLLRSPLQLALALLLATISATGLGAGLISLAPILELIIGDKGRSLRALAEEFNAQGRWVSVPDGVVALLPQEPFPSVLVVLGGVACITIIGATANFLHQSISLGLCTRVVQRIRLETFRHAIRMPLDAVVRRGPAELTSRIIRDAAELHSGLVALTNKTVAQVTKGAAAFAAAIIFDWRVVVIAALAGPLLAIVLRKTGKRIRQGTSGALRQQEVLLRVASESLQGLKAIKTSTAEGAMVGRFKQANRAVASEELRARTARALGGPLVETLAILFVIALAALAAREILRGSMGFEAFVLSLGSLAVAGGSLRPLSGFVADMQAASAPALRLREILDAPMETRRGKSGQWLPRHRHWLRVEEVSYTYPGAPVRALDGVTFEVRHGEHIAIVGPNGCGKSTLLSVLARLVTIDSGRVLLDGVDIARVELPSLRCQIAVVTQDPVIVRGTVAQNISLGVPWATRAEIEAAAARAHADGFIRALPNGFDSEVSEQGTSLSGGQRQRLAIARAVLRDGSILLLDEATSQVDAESEAQIAKAITEFGRERTVIAVAHRLSTMLAADRIVVMDRARVVDIGTHAELFDRCEVYARLVRAQMHAAPTPSP